MMSLELSPKHSFLTPDRSDMAVTKKRTVWKQFYLLVWGLGLRGGRPPPVKGFRGCHPQENFEILYSKLCILVHFSGFEQLLDMRYRILQKSLRWLSCAAFFLMTDCVTPFRRRCFKCSVVLPVCFWSCFGLMPHFTVVGPIRYSSGLLYFRRRPFVRLRGMATFGASMIASVKAAPI